MDKSIKSAILERSTAKTKKYKMTFLGKDDQKVKTTQFGMKGYQDYTTHEDDTRKERYLKRHYRDSKEPTTAGQLSRFLLWGDKPNLGQQVKAYEKKYDIKVQVKTPKK